MTDLRKIDFSREKYFECGGKKFFVTDSLSFVRWRILQKISLEFGYSATFEQMFDNLKSAVASYDKHEYFNMSVTLYKIMEGIKNLEDKDDPALRICGLFVNEENEDPTVYSDALIQAKIDCWAKEISVDSFFYLAASLIPGWMPAYQILIRNGSEKEGSQENPGQ